MRRLKLLEMLAKFSFFFCIILLTSCGSHYRGYKNAPYTVRGISYYPLDVESALYYREEGLASWYDESSFFGMRRGNTAIGEKVMPWHMSAAHKTLPLPCKVKVTNIQNGRTVTVRVNDRGPFIDGRIIDLTPRAADDLQFKNDGLTRVRVEVISVGDGDYKRSRKRRWLPF